MSQRMESIEVFVMSSDLEELKLNMRSGTIKSLETLKEKWKEHHETYPLMKPYRMTILIEEINCDEN